MHDASVAQLLCHFSLQLAPRMGGPEGVDRQEINRLTLQPGAGLRADIHRGDNAYTAGAADRLGNVWLMRSLAHWQQP